MSDPDFEALTDQLLRRGSPRSRFYGWLAFWSFFALGPGFLPVIPLSFAPGWANGWGGGLTMDVVWPAGMAFLFFIMMATSSVSASASLAWLVLRLKSIESHAVAVFRISLLLGLCASIVAAVSLNRALQDSAREMWPHGYP